METKVSGAEILLQSLLNHDINTIFGYPGSCVMAILDCLYKNEYPINHILSRHEQGAIHAAQGYALASGKVGVAITTSGPGATNAVTGIADAMANQTPLVVITGQVHSSLLGTKAFQEVDILSITQSITKWGYQICSANEISSAVAHAFFVASTGRSGPVVLDITKDAQVDSALYIPQKIDLKQFYLQKPNTQIFLEKTTTDFTKEKKTITDQLLVSLAHKDIILILDLDESQSAKIKPTSFNKVIKSNRFDTLGFGLPAAIGAKYVAGDQTVCLLTNKKRLQATVQELGIIIQSGINIKIILLQNDLSNVNEMEDPDFIQLAKAYTIESEVLSSMNKIEESIEKLLQSETTYMLEVNVEDC